MDIFVKSSYLEIYNEEIRDLLSDDPKKKLKLHEKPDSGIYVGDLSTHKIKCVEDIYELMRAG
jgi:hypothetical protein